MLARLLMAACAGAVMWLAFPGYDHWWLAPVGVAALTLATAGSGGLRGALIGFVGGLVFFLPLLEWSGIFVGWLPWVALAVLQALFFAGIGAVTGWWGPRSPTSSLHGARINPIVVGLTWVVSELGRGTIPYGGFPWGRLGFSQADAPVLGAAPLIGTPGVGFLVALAGGTAAWATLRLAGGATSLGEGPGRALVTARVGICGVTAATLGLTLLAPALVPRPVDGDDLQVLGIQGNVPQLGLDFNAQRRAVLDNHANGTLQAAARVADGQLPQPDLVIWPENASDIDPLLNDDAGEVIQDATDAIDAPVLLGAVLRVDGGLNNAQMHWRPGEGPVDSYVKQRPVPFAEYIPHREFYGLFTDTVDLVRTDFLAGTEVGTMDVQTDGRSDAVRTGIAICFEIIIDTVVRDSVIGGAEILIVPTNNATFGLSDESVQQLAASRVKAVEHGRSVVHLSNVGVSALIRPDGSMVQQSDHFTADLLSAALPLRDEQTLATRLGAWPERLALAALILFLATHAVIRRRVTSAPTGSVSRAAP